MHVRPLLILHFAAAATLLGQRAVVPNYAAQRLFANMEVVRLADGPTKVDLDGDGVLDLVFDAWRDNGNVHGFHVISFYRDGAQRRWTPEWELVTLFDSTGRHEQLSYRDFRGADCILEDLRLLRSTANARTPVTLVLARRDPGETLADTVPVTFVVYRFVRNTEELIGRPSFYFQAERSIRSQDRYCDVEAAFAQELGLGPDR